MGELQLSQYAGRIDQYLYPYYQADLEAGRLTQDQALDLVEEFFLSCNKDSDLYTGMQQGDNGQSVVLGGYDAEGNDQYNDLSELCMRACEELRLIDPKINLRVNRTTSLERYVRGSELTRLGLGFPQYSNDDVVIPCLIHWGYRPEDACNYTVAACWEFIIPGYGMDIPNINGLVLRPCGGGGNADAAPPARTSTIFWRIPDRRSSVRRAADGFPSERSTWSRPR